MGANREMSDTLVSSSTSLDLAPSGAGDWILIALTGPHVGRIYPLSRHKLLHVIGRGDEADVQILDAEISRRHAMIRYDAATDTFFVTDLNSRNGTNVNGRRCAGETPIAVGDKIGLGKRAVLRVSSESETEAAYAKQMYQAALRDALTGVFNRRYLDERVESEAAFARRHGEPLALLLLDIDFFKRVNDEHGHSMGDALLQHFGKLMQAKVRTEDVVARYGGEEFAVLCRQIDETRAAVLAERLRAAVELTPLELRDGGTLAVTVSIGVSAFGGAVDSVAKLFDAADAALYHAKRTGRNRVSLSSQLPVLSSESTLEPNSGTK